ncbi:MAG: hypothetical protein K9J37_04410 [Saprospiraceae bacterium]|nr:hypothetical protein [Saprospiraceae bacterium]MCF8249128.1 hypothetical protein [Saprospiraceae bacterium]MCF8281385.1 hypothetical protein [Bacteroidales bacterium]MCF8311150.1 hypothetical protein [Saprospiraceae bacterium]MCF8440240.1 hypothetical protein [Saprospiraceae bacterium]
MKKHSKSILLFCLFAHLNMGLLIAQNLVPNPQFEINRPTSATYSFNNPQMECYRKGCTEMENLFRYSQTQNWTLWLGTTLNNACVMTELVKTAGNCIPAGPKGLSGNMMHVKTTYGGMGIVNSDIPAGNSKVKITCWVYVVKGKAYMGYGPTGSPIKSASSSANCKWEKLEITKTGSEACNQVVIYSDSVGDAEFYVDAVSVVKI